MTVERYFQREWHDSNKKITRWGIAMIRVYLGIGFILGSFTTLLLYFIISEALK